MRDVVELKGQYFPTFTSTPKGASAHI